MKAKRYAAVVLAAGSASRFGKTKQLLRWRGESLVSRAVRACDEADFSPIVAVTGANQAELVHELKLHSANPLHVHCADWASGMQASLASGIEAVQEAAPTAEATCILLVDQPLVDAAALRELTSLLSPQHDAAALAYPSGPGVPALLRTKWLPQLTSDRQGGGGARRLLRDPALKLALLDAPDLRRDIDTLADWHAFLDDYQPNDPRDQP